MALIEGALGRVPEEARRTLRSYLADVTKHFGPDLEAVVLYGSAARGDYLSGRSNLNVLLLLKEQHHEVLKKYVKLHRRWKNEGVVVPLFLTREELQASAEVFPLEYLDISEQHLVLSGRDPFTASKVDERHLRRQCEQELRGNLLRLRQRFIEGGGEPEAVVILMSLSVTALLPCLRGLLRLTGRPIPKSVDDLLRSLRSDLGADGSVFLEAQNVKRGLITPGPVEIPRLFERYLAGLQSLIERVEQLKSEGRL